MNKRTARRYLLSQETVDEMKKHLAGLRYKVSQSTYIEQAIMEKLEREGAYNYVGEYPMGRIIRELKELN